MTTRQISIDEDDFQAFVDGQLPPDRRRAVMAYLAARPEESARMSDYRRLTEELELHRSLSGEFGADLTTKDKGPACEAYTSWILDAAADYRDGLAAVYPCMWGYNQLGVELAPPRPREPRYRRWVDTYADPGFTELTEKYGRMLEEADPDPERAERFFLEGMRHEVAFWDVPL
jgi:thiaminase (transcriptional activator TenA)